jgi:IclR family acetate operon transcriptional repressor
MQSHERLFAILSALGEHATSTLTEIATRVDLPKPTVLRVLRSLEPDAWVTRTADGGYALGPSILGLAGQYLSLDSVIAAASPPMMRLRDTLGETATLSRVSGSTRICVQEFPSTQPLRLVLGLGALGPLHAGASGLVLLAHMPAEARAEVLSSQLEALTDQTITSAKALELECERIRDQGWAISRGQLTAGGVAMAVPIEDPSAEWGVSALGVYGPDVRCRTAKDERRWLKALRACAAEIADVRAGR